MSNTPQPLSLRKASRKKQTRFEDLAFPKEAVASLEKLSRSWADQLDRETFSKKYAPVTAVLKLVGAGAFLAASVAAPNLPSALKPFLNKKENFEAWKRFNIPYLKRTLARLEKQKLVEIKEEKDAQTVRITDRGRKRLLKYSLDELAIEKPKRWDGSWRLISYDIPKRKESLRKVFHEYLRVWGCYPLHESVFLHAFPCEQQVEFLCSYLGIGEEVRIFTVSKIENDASFREFFGV